MTKPLGRLRIDPAWSSVLIDLDIDPMPITARHAERVEHLPWHHRDPFDRLLATQASLEDHALVSADPRLAEYGVEVVW